MLRAFGTYWDVGYCPRIVFRSPSQKSCIISQVPTKILDIPRVLRITLQICSCLWHMLTNNVIRSFLKFGPVYLLQASKNDDEKRCFFQIIWHFYIHWYKNATSKRILPWVKQHSAIPMKHNTPAVNSAFTAIVTVWIPVLKNTCSISIITCLTKAKVWNESEISLLTHRNMTLVVE